MPTNQVCRLQTIWTISGASMFSALTSQTWVLFQSIGNHALTLRFLLQTAFLCRIGLLLGAVHANRVAEGPFHSALALEFEY